MALTEEEKRARLWNRFAHAGGRFTDEEESDHYAALDAREGVEEEALGPIAGVDVNPANYIAAAATGAFGGILSKADDDLEDVQKELRKGKKKKKKKKRVEAEPEVEAEPVPVPPRLIVNRNAVKGLVPWYWRYRKYLPWAAAGTAVAAVGLAVRRR